MFILILGLQLNLIILEESWGGGFNRVSNPQVTETIDKLLHSPVSPVVGLMLRTYMASF
ncbi:hypothetical protein BCR34DRAFT_608987 [Clohesyomyces aquaticus]|uniref:Uncharacterized protein n=1 Tax=Clohesyomyces aquaticus TaxID=1231657 RepID=A0A1Y1Y0I0_9PLEO|nr:hypothetical protein BCR34DRAFT_608987 [Clohesyomyces aquaticus]